MELVRELGREPSSEEMATRLGLSVIKIRELKRIAQEPISLQTPVGVDEESHLGDFIEDRASVSPADAVIDMNLREQTASILKTLTPREEKVIKMRFGLEDGEPRTLEEVGRAIGVTRERTRQIEAEVVRKLRAAPDTHRLRSFLRRASSGNTPQIGLHCPAGKEASVDVKLLRQLEFEQFRRNNARGGERLPMRSRSEIDRYPCGHGSP